jgi:trehalose 6-phosphate synthase/phosphatase
MDDIYSKRLILVSNRLPFQLVEKDGEISLKQSDGGLVTALKGYFEQHENGERFQEKIWVGSADFPEKRWKRYQESPAPQSFQIDALFINPKSYNKYYNGFCNATLWPLFHYFPSYVVYDDEYFEEYERVNQQFANHLVGIMQPGDTVWIHDYQLFLVPQLVRERIPDATIGFFLHIPFPSFEVFRLLHRPWKEKIVRGMLGADLIGFHTHEYVQHFLKAVRMITGHDHNYRAITHENRLVKTELFPLGVDYEKFNGSAKREDVASVKEEIQRNFPDKKIIFSVDRLDYTKGITHRLDGYERFLDQYPEWREKVVFILVVVPSRQIISKYNERRKLIEEQVGGLNGKFSTLAWQPVIYRYSTLEFAELCALYGAAHAALITPLRDGMNLVAKEYVAASADHGVLILSELAGAAIEMGEAILVNPLDASEMATAINQALTMPALEQKHRLSVMRKRLSDYDVLAWVNDYLSQLAEVKGQQKQEHSKYLSPGIRKNLVRAYQKAKHRSLLLDYDGTLVPFARNPREAIPDPELLALLNALGAKENTSLTIISGRDAASLEEWFGDIPVNLVAEHGATVRRIGRGWTNAKTIDQSWKPILRPTLEMFVKRCPRSFIEEKNHTLAWHYRNVDPELGFLRSRELLDSLFHLVRNGQLQVIDGNKVIEIRMAGIDKGVAARSIIERAESDFILVVGDDKTDEDMFKTLAGQATTIKVGSGHSAAQYSLNHHSEVIRLLIDLAATHKEQDRKEDEMMKTIRNV